MSIFLKFTQISFRFFFIIAGVVLLLSSPAQATNGYFAHGYGIRNRAMAGTGAALPQDAVAAAVNPAGMAFVGNQLDLEIELFNPHRSYNVQGEPTFAPDAFPLQSDEWKATVNTSGFQLSVGVIAWIINKALV